MGTFKPKNLAKQSNHPADKNNAMQLDDQKYDHLWAAHKWTAAQHVPQTGNIYVQTNKDNDAPALERRSLVPGITALQEDQISNDGILTEQDADYDNDHANAGHQNNTSQTVIGNDT